MTSLSSPTRPSSRLASRRAVGRLAGGALLTLLGLPGAATAQYRLAAPGGDTLAFPAAEVRAMLDTTRALRADLERDPEVAYDLRFGDRVPAASPDSAYPWNAVQPQSDSLVIVYTPGNLREADRAYENYAVIRMHRIRETDPDDPCDAIVAREAEAVSAFADGWIVARTLFGGPPYPPLDAIAFARAAGHLESFLADRRNRWIGACAAEWASAHPAAIAAYRAWQERAFPGEGDGPGEGAGGAEGTSAGGEG